MEQESENKQLKNRLSNLSPTGWLWLTLSFICSPGSYADNASNPVFVCWVAQDLPLFGELNRIYSDAFAALGYGFEMVHQPPARASASALSGNVDGECVRSAQYGALMKDSPMVRLDVLIAHTELVVWSHRQDLEFTNPNQLTGRDYRVGYLRGTAIMSLIWPKEVLALMEEIHSTDLALKMLAAKRIDVLVAPSAIIDQQLRRGNYGKDLHQVGSLMKLEAYPYIHKRWQPLLPTLTEELQKRVPAGGLSLQ